MHKYIDSNKSDKEIYLQIQLDACMRNMRTSHTVGDYNRGVNIYTHPFSVDINALHISKRKLYLTRWFNKLPI